MPLVALSMAVTGTTFAQSVLKEPVKTDVFELNKHVPAEGTTHPSIIYGAPDSRIEIQGEYRNAVIVVDLDTNVLYKYDEEGNPEAAYLVASGKPSTPTETGVRVVKWVETYPYRSAGVKSKRYKNPRDYGPKIIVLDKINPKTGETSPTGEFIHGNRNSSTLGKYVSKGCIRMDNEVIKELSSQVKSGDIILIKRGR